MYWICVDMRATEAKCLKEACDVGVWSVYYYIGMVYYCSKKA